MLTFSIEQLDEFGYWVLRSKHSNEGEAFNHYHFLCQEFLSLKFRLIKIQSAVIASN